MSLQLACNIIVTLMLVGHFAYHRWIYPKWWARVKVEQLDKVITDLKSKHGETIFIDLDKGKVLVYHGNAVH